MPDPPEYARVMFFPLDAPIRDYAWGSSGVISHFRGAVGPDRPEAEQWFGNHPESQTVIQISGENRDFHQWLGETTTQFPLLVKLLAARQPLSIQAHPGAQQAKEGFAAEVARGIAEESRTYRDASAKPELLIALSSRFHALVGFVDHAEMERRAQLWRRSGLKPSVCGLLATALTSPLEDTISWILENGADVKECVSALEEWAASSELLADSADDDTSEFGFIRDLSAFHPGDPGILLSAFMHHVILARGEAVFVDAGIVHAYLQGFGLEVMLPSDNVVRAGLTTKPRDTDAFLRIADTSAISAPPIVMPSDNGSHRRYDGFAADFAVTHITGSNSVSLGNSAAVIVVEEGAGTLSGDVSDTAFGEGDVFYVSSDEGTVTARGAGSVWVVHPT